MGGCCIVHSGGYARTRALGGVSSGHAGGLGAVRMCVVIFARVVEGKSVAWGFLGRSRGWGMRGWYRAE